MIRFTLSVLNADAVASVFQRAAKDVQAAVRREVRATGRQTRELTQFLCPVDTGFMQRHVRETYSNDGFAFEVGWDARDFVEAGLPFYPPFQEFGTSRMRAQPSLLPAYEETRPQFLANLRKILQDAPRKAKRNRR